MRTVGSSSDKTWSIIRKAAIELLFRFGFHAMNLRLLASEAGLTAGSLYNYFGNKEELLAELLCDIMSDLLQQIKDNVRTDVDPVTNLKRFIEIMVIWHTKRRKEAAISQTEMRSLPRHKYKEFLALRKQFEIVFQGIIEEGVDTEVFEVNDIALTTVTILNQLVSIAFWYKPNGRLSVEALIEEYTGSILRMLAYHESNAKTSRRRAKVGRARVRARARARESV